MKRDILDEPFETVSSRKKKIIHEFMNGVYILVGSVIGLIGSYELIKILK